jgi:hypothetical protein
MLIAGILWHFWGRRVLTGIQSRRMMAPAAAGHHE